MVTHYAEPFGYISGWSYFPRSGRSHATGRARPLAAGKSACRTDRSRVSRIPSGHLQAFTSPPPRPSGAGAALGASSLLPAQPRTTEGGGFMVGAIPRLLADQLGRLEGICGS